ncbi:hypothetical protein [Jeotgalibacillus sp. JSM ZJ347]|uniref:hypothetical protein n=1 Tax=Jeotgalibacillus sp. JSM ZJ347 TaxID=3342117 RepID=UPI0035A86D8A
MKFFKKQIPQQTNPDNQLMEDEKKRLIPLIEQEVQARLADYQAELIMNKIIEKVRRIKFVHMNELDYQYELMKSTVFYMEMSKSLQRSLADKLRGDTSTESVSDMKKRTNREIEKLIETHYEDFYTKYLNHPEGLNGLERAYQENLLQYEALKKLLSDISVADFQTIDDLPKRWIVRRMAGECRRWVDEVMYL